MKDNVRRYNIQDVWTEQVETFSNVVENIL